MYGGHAGAFAGTSIYLVNVIFGVKPTVMLPVRVFQTCAQVLVHSNSSTKHLETIWP